MFRRRRREDADQAEYSGADATGGEDWADDEETSDGFDAHEASGLSANGLAGGPWDADDAFPVRDRADFGSVLVPITPMQQIELATDGQRVIWVSVKSGQSELRVHAFAAPRSAGLWDDVRPEIAASGYPAVIVCERPVAARAHIALKRKGVPWRHAEC